MLFRLSSVCTLFYVVVCFRYVAASHPGLYRRQDASPTTAVTSTATQDGDQEATTTAQADSSDTTTNLPESTKSIEITTSSASSSPAETAISSAINGNNPSNESYAQDPIIAKGELPLQPRLTPGWGVSGAILLITGVVYTLIGIKNTWLHTFFSSAYLASLCVTVLIVYVMNPPVSDAIQGAYVVGVVCSGLILGGAATIFKELTEGLGCLLGGFCFAMWLLTLHDGGLLPSTVGKVIFITAFTVAGFALYFSRYTRAYSLIVLMSFAGATVTVLGIDCFSRAGLKEFWVYIWNLNDNLFPLAADTYPLTKGVRVEIAVIVVLTILGIISQLRLWRVIQQHREKRAEEQAEFERMRDEEEASVGRRVEEDNERERRQWEMTYGDAPPPTSPTATSPDSGVGEIESEKKGRFSQTTVQQVSPSETDNENTIEMTDFSASNSTTSPEVTKQMDDLGIVRQDEDKRITIRVSRDDRPDHDGELSPIPEPDEKSWMAGANGDTPHSPVTSPRNSHRISSATGPEIVPLPFIIPGTYEEDVDDEDRSSFATFADEDERSMTMSKRASRASLSNRLSVGSGNLLRSLSQRSQKSKRHTGEFELPQQFGESGEDLVDHNQKRTDDTGSIAATVDGMSLNDDEKIEPAEDGASRWTMEIKAELGGRLPEDQLAPKDTKPTVESKPDESKGRLGDRPKSTADTVATDILNPSFLGEPAGGRSKRSSATHATAITEETNETSNPDNAPGSKAPSETSKVAKSLSPSAKSSASLTKEALPSSLSRVALSYRTNEWAKHLSLAEKPGLETLQLNEYLEGEETNKQKQETPAPLYVEELQQTPEGGIPAAPITRSPSSVSNVHVHRSPSRTSAAGMSTIAQTIPLSTPSTGQMPEASGNRSSMSLVNGLQQHALHASHSVRMKGRRQSGDVVIQPILEENGDEHLSVKTVAAQEDGVAPNRVSASPVEFESPESHRAPVPGVVSYSSPQTLLGKRDMFLRSKSQSTLLLSAPIQEAGQYGLRPSSQMEPARNFSTPSPLAVQDADDLPLSQRKELIRQSSMLSARSMAVNPRPNSVLRVASNPTLNVPPVTSDNSHFDSHQPQRRSTVQPYAQREAQLASFRQSVAAELRASTLMAPAVNNGRETPLVSGSNTLLGGIGPQTENHDVQYQMEQQRSMLLSQREEEAQRKEYQRMEKERNDRAFEEMMRRGDLMDAHREALRRMQKTVKDQ
ncbi:hypothetical protein GGR52DRAFT_231832 [Hypoxylon sp. FL1284]|nr:hypothetical protein GGR52DRAFT_231832 [Hypoxylon sp. FL1284]